MSKRRELGRGLDDLIATHDTDLPFLDSYGDSDGDPEAGLPLSAGGDDVEELLDAFVRLLRSEGADVSSSDRNASVEPWLEMECVDEGVLISVKVELPLPLVESDIQEAGFENGALSDDRCNVSVILTRWGVPTRRLLSRLHESQK